MSGNPTLDAANAATGEEPLNIQPNGPQPPQHAPVVSDPTIDQLPPALRNLPAPFESFVLPLDSENTRTKNNQSISTDYPDSSRFEELVKATLKPEGPVRAESVRPEDVTWPEGCREIMKKIELTGEERDLKVYQVVQGVGKGEMYAVTLDLDNDRMLGVKFPKA